MNDSSQRRWRTPGNDIREPPYRDSDPTTPDLILRVREGDDEALEALFARYLPRMQRWASGRLPPGVRPMVETGDLVQSTFLKTSSRISRFEPRHPGSFPAYLRKTMLNLIRDAARRAHSLPDLKPLAGDERDSAPTPLDVVVGSELFERYETAFARLSQPDQAAIFLRIELDLSFSEIALALDKPSEDAARMATRRAVIRLAREMKHVGQDT